LDRYEPGSRKPSGGNVDTGWDTIPALQYTSVTGGGGSRLNKYKIGSTLTSDSGLRYNVGLGGGIGEYYGHSSNVWPGPSGSGNDNDINYHNEGSLYHSGYNEFGTGTQGYSHGSRSFFIGGHGGLGGGRWWVNTENTSDHYFDAEMHLPKLKWPKGRTNTGTGKTKYPTGSSQVSTLSTNDGGNEERSYHTLTHDEQGNNYERPSWFMNKNGGTQLIPRSDPDRAVSNVWSYTWPVDVGGGGIRSNFEPIAAPYRRDGEGGTHAVPLKRGGNGGSGNSFQWSFSHAYHTTNGPHVRWNLTNTAHTIRDWIPTDYAPAKGEKFTQKNIDFNVFIKIKKLTN
jgi:hypothetical protein